MIGRYPRPHRPLATHPKLIAGPLVEPISWVLTQAEEKVTIQPNRVAFQLRVSSARASVEKILHRKLVQQTWDLLIDDNSAEWDESFLGRATGYGFASMFGSASPNQRFELPFPPVQAVIGVYVRDVYGVETLVDPSVYYVTTGNQPTYVCLAQGQVWPQHQAFESFRIRFTCGYVTPFTIMNDGSGVVLAQNHGYMSGDNIQFSSPDGQLNGPLQPMQNYTVTNLTPTGFQVIDSFGNLVQPDPNYQGTGFIGTIPSPIVRALVLMSASNIQGKIAGTADGGQKGSKLEGYATNVTPEDLLEDYIWRRI